MTAKRVVLQISSASGEGRNISVAEGGVIKVGRAHPSGFVIANDPRISKVHFMVECDADGGRIRDLQSTNGTFVNGSRIREARLREGDRIEAGDTTFTVRADVGESSHFATVRDPAAHDSATVAGGAPNDGESAVPVMRVENSTPFAVGTMTWEDLDGRARFTVIVKATFTVKDGRVAASKEQFSVLTSDERYGDDVESVKFESDMVPIKSCADVVAVARAHAPGGRPVPGIDVTLRVGRLEKRLRVFGDRKWWFPSRVTVAPRIGEPQPFVKMDIVYERAFGGLDAAAAAYCRENLVGRGLIGKKQVESVHEKPLPNIEDPSDLIRSWDSRPTPAGFGFYPRGSMPRFAHAGTYDDRYRKERAPAMPNDFSYAFYNGAHPDLQMKGYLRGDEDVELVNLSPEGRIAFKLPAIHPKVTLWKWTTSVTEWLESSPAESRPEGTRWPLAREPMKMVLDTLVLVPDQDLFYEVFRGSCVLTKLDAAEIGRIKVEP